MVSKTKITKAAKEYLQLAHMLPSANVVGNQEYVPEPPHYEEKLCIYKSQIIIPDSISGNIHALMGPMCDPSVDLTKIMDFSPAYHMTKPVVSIKEPLNLSYMTANLCVFRSAPPSKKHEDYIL